MADFLCTAGSRDCGPIVAPTDEYGKVASNCDRFVLDEPADEPAPRQENGTNGTEEARITDDAGLFPRS